MKKLLVLFSILITSFTFAQIKSLDSTYIEGVKKDLKGTFTQAVKENMKLTEEQGKIFWPLYEEYMAARIPIFDERVNLTEEYMMNYYSLDDATAKDILNRAMKLNHDLLEVRDKYINKMMEKLPIPLVGKYFQIDNRISALVDLVRMSSTPLVRDEEE